MDVLPTYQRVAVVFGEFRFFATLPFRLEALRHSCEPSTPTTWTQNSGLIYIDA